jgi:hypothetical protein
VRDVDDADALRLQVLDHVEQHDLLRIGQRGGGLVEDHGLGVDGQRAGDLHHLLVGDGQVADQRAGVEADLQLFEDRVGAVIERAPVDAAEALARQLAQIDVLGHRHFLREAQFLVDEHDALGLGLQRPLHHGPRARSTIDAALVGLVDAAQHLHQRRFAGAVLAHQGVNLARQDREADTPSSARTPGKVLTMPSRRSAGCGRSYLQLLCALAVELPVEEQHRDQDQCRSPGSRFRCRADMAQPLAQQLDRDHPAERADDRPLAAGQLGAAQHDGGDRPKLEQHGRHSGSPSRFGVEDHRRERGEKADQHEVDHDVRADADAGVHRRLAVVADGIGVAAMHRAVITNQTIST